MRTITFVVAVATVFVFLTAGGLGEETAADFSEVDVLYRGPLADIEGTYVVARGNIYRERGNGGYDFVAAYYDPDFLSKNYRFEDGIAFKIDPAEPNTLYETSQSLTDGFERVDTVRELIAGPSDLLPVVEKDGERTIYRTPGMRTRWTELTLQSPRSPEVSDYVALRHRILEEGADFLDNRVDVTTVRAHGGARSLRFFSVAPRSGMVTAKSSVASNMFHFAKGDTFSFTGWFFFEEGVPTTIVDLESTWLLHRGGIRVLFSRNGRPYVELKGADKPVWRSEDPDYRVPTGRWFHLRFETYLDDFDGVVRLWIDDVPLVEGRGRTLVLQDTVLDSLEIGISATSVETVLYVDDVVVSGGDGFRPGTLLPVTK